VRRSRPAAQRQRERRQRLILYLLAAVPASSPFRTPRRWLVLLQVTGGVVSVLAAASLRPPPSGTPVPRWRGTCAARWPHPHRRSVRPFGLDVVSCRCSNEWQGRVTHFLASCRRRSTGARRLRVRDGSVRRTAGAPSA
jgi:hypothetical protein